MKTIFLHAVSYGLTYILLSVIFLSVIGVVNQISHKPFFYHWRDRLVFITLILSVNCLVDLFPRNILIIVGIFAGATLLVGVVWFFIKCPSRLPKQE